MASTDARPVPQKNVAYRVTFPILDADGDLVTGATGLDSEVSKDGGTFADCTNEATEIATSSGMYYLDLTATEMDADTVAIIVKTSSSGAKTTPIVLYPEEAGDIRVNVTAFGGTAGTFSGGRPEVNASHFAGTAYATALAAEVDAVWDEVLTAATHNVASSAGRRLRQVDGAFVITTGTAQAGGASSITLAAGESATNDIYKNDGILIVGGTGTGETAIITAYNGTTKVATVSPAWVITPDNTSLYEIVPSLSSVGQVADNAITAASLASDAGTEIGTAVWAATTRQLTGTQTFNLTGDITGNLSGSVGSVTGAVGSVTASVTVGTNNDKTGYALSAAGNLAVMTEAHSEPAYPTALDTTLSASQMLYATLQLLTEHSISGTTWTIKKRDQSTTAMTLTLDNGTTPSAVTQA